MQFPSKEQPIEVLEHPLNVLYEKLQAGSYAPQPQLQTPIVKNLSLPHVNLDGCDAVYLMYKNLKKLILAETFLAARS